MKNIDRPFLVFILVGALNLVGSFLILGRLPEVVPMHWNLQGEVDGWGPRNLMVLLGALPLILAVLGLLVPRFDPKKENYEKHWGTYQLFFGLIVGLMVGIFWLTVSWTLDFWKPDMALVVPVALGFIFLVMGNTLPRVRFNYTFGIRLPWTLADERVWKKTHRVGGVLMILFGLCLVAAGFLPYFFKILLFTLGLLIFVVGTALYSWRSYQKLKPQ